MTARKPCPAAPGPLEEYARQFDDCFGSLAQRRAFRDYLVGLLLPHDRHKTLTALAGTEPVLGAQHPEAQRLQFFLSESGWDVATVNARRVALLLGDPTTAPHAHGVLVVDDTGDRKDGHHTAHVARQYLGSVGKIDNGIVAVTTLWADERVYYPLHVVPYTPARRLPRGRSDPAFRTKPELAVELVAAARAASVPFEAVVADSFYGDHLGFEEALLAAAVPFVLALKPTKGRWAPEDDDHTPEEAARHLRWGGPRAPGDWHAVTRRFRDGHTETWWVAEAPLVGYGLGRATRLVVATTDPPTLPRLTTWYLTTNLPNLTSPPSRLPTDRPPTGQHWSRRHRATPLAPAELAEVVRLYGLRIWVEQGYRQVKGELGWADFQVRADHAIRRHWALVSCAFSCCWRAWFGAREAVWPPLPTTDLPPDPSAPVPLVSTVSTEAQPATPAPAEARGKKGRAAAPSSLRSSPAPAASHPNATAVAQLAHGPAPRAELARSLERHLADLARLVHGVTATRPPVAARPRRRRLQSAAVSPLLTNYR
jgi:hypothetical protein